MHDLASESAASATSSERSLYEIDRLRQVTDRTQLRCDRTIRYKLCMLRADCYSYKQAGVLRYIKWRAPIHPSWKRSQPLLVSSRTRGGTPQRRPLVGWQPQLLTAATSRKMASSPIQILGAAPLSLFLSLSFSSRSPSRMLLARPCATASCATAHQNPCFRVPLVEPILAW